VHWRTGGPVRCHACSTLPFSNCKQPASLPASYLYCIVSAQVVVSKALPAAAPTSGQPGSAAVTVARRPGCCTLLLPCTALSWLTQTPSATQLHIHCDGHCPFLIHKMCSHRDCAMHGAELFLAVSAWADQDWKMPTNSLRQNLKQFRQGQTCMLT
jgi:hypothetical protein